LRRSPRSLPQKVSLSNNLGIRLSELGRQEDALQATTEAVDIYRSLAQANPAAFEPDLAQGLQAFAWVRATEQTELAEALLAAQESITIYEGLAQRLPRTFDHALRGALTTLAGVLDGLGRGDDAVFVRNRIRDLTRK
jgi:tetratricopeptide (TPR) repeat protein